MNNKSINKNINPNCLLTDLKLDSIEDIIKLNSSLINKVLLNELDQGVCTGIGYLLKLQLKCIELNSLEKRISDIEEKLK